MQPASTSIDDVPELLPKPLIRRWLAPAAGGVEVHDVLAVHQEGDRPCCVLGDVDDRRQLAPRNRLNRAVEGAASTDPSARAELGDPAPADPPQPGAP